MARAINISPEEKAWAKYFRARFENMSCPDPLVMLAIKDAFRFAFREAAQLRVNSERANTCACGNAISPHDQCEGCAGLV